MGVAEEAAEHHLHCLRRVGRRQLADRSYSLLFGQNDRLPMLLDDLDGHAWYHEGTYDPFEESGSAAAHYREGDLLPVLEHNLADVHRTWELGELVRRFVSPKDVTEKKL